MTDVKVHEQDLSTARSTLSDRTALAKLADPKSTPHGLRNRGALLPREMFKRRR
jgi:hypothetical protein